MGSGIDGGTFNAFLLRENAAACFRPGLLGIARLSIGSVFSAVARDSLPSPLATRSLAEGLFFVALSEATREGIGGSEVDVDVSLVDLYGLRSDDE